MNVEFKYHRRSIRLRHYDYTMPGGYFITICTQNRDCLFGSPVGANGVRPDSNSILPDSDIVGASGARPYIIGARPYSGDFVGANGIRPDPEIILNEYGKIAKEEWLKTIDIRNEIVLDEFVVMPNHFHAIVFITPCTGDRPYRNGEWLHCKGDRLVAPTTSPIAPTIAPNGMPTGPESKSIGALMAGYKSVVTKRINTLRHTPGFSVWQRNYYEHIIRDDKELNEIREYILLNPVNWEKDNEFKPVLKSPDPNITPP